MPFVLVFPFFQKKKLFILFAMQLSIFFLALLRILTYGNSRVLPALFRFARDSGSLLAFLPSLSPLPTYFFNKSLVGSNGLGPSTSRLSGVCSNQLSYEPVLVEVIGFEPIPPACRAGALPTELYPRSRAQLLASSISRSPRHFCRFFEK